jgi:hypothetical protein
MFIQIILVGFVFNFIFIFFTNSLHLFLADQCFSNKREEEEENRHYLNVNQCIFALIILRKTLYSRVNKNGGYTHTRAKWSSDKQIGRGTCGLK